ncbi:hypothetical protein CLU79DRAFT_733423 [Phycomyces nitens]|nr:hypothetical protein CLU79DRAFT_733423 [Phycomyces nitens]
MANEPKPYPFKQVNFVAGSSLKLETVEEKPAVAGDEIADLYRQLTECNPSRSTNDLTIYCADCEMDILVGSYQKHIRGMAHMISRQSQPPPDVLGLNSTNKGFQMLRKQGWRYEEGLGASEQGRRHPIATTFKHDRLCIGHKKTGPKAVTHTWSAIERARMADKPIRNLTKPLSGKALAAQAQKDAKKRAAMIHYMNQ